MIHVGVPARALGLAVLLAAGCATTAHPRRARSVGGETKTRPKNADPGKRQTAARDRLRKLTLALVALDRRVQRMAPGPRAEVSPRMRQVGLALRQGIRALESGDLAEAERSAEEAQRLGAELERAIEAQTRPGAAAAAQPRESNEADAYMAGHKRCAAMTAAECDAACEAGDPAMCTAMAGRRFDGDGVKADPEGAVKAWRQICKGGYRAACVTLEKLLEKGGQCTTEANCAEGCGRALGSACLKLGSKYLDGDGVAKDAGAALQKFRRGCELGYGEACRAAGFVHGKGLGVPKTMATATEWMKKGCDLGDESSCFQAANTACVADAINAKQRRTGDDTKCKRVRDSGKNLRADPRKDYSAYEAPDESKLDLCYEAVMSEGCFQINVNKDPFRAIYCCPK